MAKTKTKTTDQLGQALTVAARRYRARQALMLANIGLFPGQDQVLRALGEVDGIAMGEMAEMLKIKPPTASKMIARMAAEGLVERRSAEGDGRSVAVFILPEGVSRLGELDRISRKLEKHALVGLDDKDARRLRRLLKRVSRNLAPRGETPDLDDGDAVEDQGSDDLNAPSQLRVATVG